jgi:hypothetical protein
MKTYFTVEEFIDAYSAGLHGVLLGVFKKFGKHHIEDLMSHASSYAESTFQFVASIPGEAYPQPPKEQAEFTLPTNRYAQVLSGENRLWTLGAGNPHQWTTLGGEVYTNEQLLQAPNLRVISKGIDPTEDAL